MLVENNLIQNNWSGVDLYTDDSRFSGGPSRSRPRRSRTPTPPTTSSGTRATVDDGVTNGTTTITSSGGFTQFFHPSGNYCSTTRAEHHARCGLVRLRLGGQDPSRRHDLFVLVGELLHADQSSDRVHHR